MSIQLLMGILPAGDEVTISYIGNIEVAVSQRRHRLLQGWDFRCKCPRCEVEDRLPRSITRLVATITDQMKAEEDKPIRILSLYRQGRLQMFHCTLILVHIVPKAQCSGFWLCCSMVISQDLCSALTSMQHLARLQQCYDDSACLQQCPVDNACFQQCDFSNAGALHIDHICKQNQRSFEVLVYGTSNSSTGSDFDGVHALNSTMVAVPSLVPNAPSHRQLLLDM